MDNLIKWVISLAVVFLTFVIAGALVFSFVNFPVVTLSILIAMIVAFLTTLIKEIIYG